MKAAPMTVQCSILICTYNRAEILGETLACLMEQVRMRDDVEVLVVDNGSPDHTKSVVERFAEVKYVHEARVGLSHARNRAVEEATYEHLIFIDDDVVPETEWLSAYFDFFEKRPESVSFWGGPVTPYWAVESPPELSDSELRYMSRAWSLVDPLGEADAIQSEEALMPIGANFGGLRTMFLDLKFDLNLGRQGLKMTSLEESELLHRALAKGLIGGWVKGASLGHRISSERLSKSYLAKFYYGFGRSEQAYQSSHGVMQLLARCLRFGLSNAFSSIRLSSSSSLRHFVKWHYYRGQFVQALCGKNNAQ